MAIKADEKGRTWDTDEVKCDSIEFALLHPEYAGFKPTDDDLAFIRRLRPDSEALKCCENCVLEPTPDLGPSEGKGK